MHEDFCYECKDKNCKICPLCGSKGGVLEVSDSYRRSVENGYYTTTVLKVKRPDGTTYYTYNKMGE